MLLHAASGLRAVVLPGNTVLCLLNGQPAASCTIRYGVDPTYRILPNTELRGSFTTCTTQDLMAPNTIVQPQSSCSEASGNIRLACYSGVTPGSTVTYRYPPGSSVSQSTRRCQSDGTWSGTTPSNGELSHTAIGHKVHWYSGHSSPFNCFIKAFISFGVKWICKASFRRSSAELLVQK